MVDTYDVGAGRRDRVRTAHPQPQRAAAGAAGHPDRRADPHRVPAHAAVHQPVRDLDDVQRTAYLGVLCGSVVATGLIIAPVAFHRMLFRRGQRPWLVTTANWAARAGLLALALTTSGVVWLVFDLVTDRTLASVAGAVSLLFFGTLWVVVPLRAAPGAENRRLAGAQVELGAQVLEDPGEQPGHLHLGDADVLGDLLLGPALEEPQLEDPTVTRRELAHGRAEHHAGLGAVELHVLVGHQVAEGGGAVLPHRYVERGRRERAVGGQRLDDGLDVEAELLRRPRWAAGSGPAAG